MLKGLIGWKRYAVFGLFALLLIAAIVMGVKSCKEIDQENDNVLINSGVTSERVKNQEGVLNSVKEANDARDNPSVNDVRVVCEKYDRNCTPTNQ